MSNSTRHIQKRSRARSGFTLVELLVAVALVLIIMVLMANVFGLAAKTVEKQQGTAENDQQARTLVTVLKGDLCARTFRVVYAYPSSTQYPTFDSTANPGPLYSADTRRGYFSISENDPDNNGDDVLSLTVKLDDLIADCVYDVGTESFYGVATVLTDGTTPPLTYLAGNKNQPEFDDGYPALNDLSRSKSAEVVYFLRNGNLYRRVMLIRTIEDSETDTSAQPKEINDPYTTGVAYAPRGTGNFWSDFDFSAYIKYDTVDGEYRPAFHADVYNKPPDPALSDDKSLSNETGVAPLVQVDDLGLMWPASLGVPAMRYGHDIFDFPLGRPKEFLGGYTNGSADNFFGRFVGQEISHPNFVYPGNRPGAGNPHSRNDLSWGADRLVNQYSDPTHTVKRGDDILLTGVLEFDVKVWDNQAKAFVDIGHNLTDNNGNPLGHYNINNRLNPSASYAHVFDTWNPNLSNPSNPPSTLPPYRPVSVGMDGAPGAIGADEDGDGNLNFLTSGEPDLDELGWPGTDDELPLKTIQITVRYVEPRSKLIRQVTIIQSLQE